MSITLKSEFQDIISGYANSAIAAQYWAEVDRAYAQKGRHYHTMQHLENMYAQLSLVRPAISHWDIVIPALAYHDIVYKPKKSDNELQSAVMAVSRLQAIGVDNTLIQPCHEMILATKTHLLSDQSDINYFTDADLSVLGADPENLCRLYPWHPKGVRNLPGSAVPAGAAQGRTAFPQHEADL